MTQGEIRALAEDGDPALDSTGFRRCLGEFATGVTVITTEVGAERFGVTANSFSSLSLDPPLVLWSIGRSSRSIAAFEQATHFAVNVLALEQVKVSQNFASKEADKFAAIAWTPGIGGSPLVDGALATLECETEAVHEGGDHLLLIGRVKRFARREGKALLFVQGRYGAAGDHPDQQEKKISSPADPTARAEGELPFGTLLAQTHHVLEREFDAHRSEEGVTLTENKVMVGLFDQPGLSLDRLAKKIYFGRRELEDAVAELQMRGLVQNDDGSLSLTAAGREKRLAVMRRVRMLDIDRFADLSADEIRVTEDVLRKLQAKAKASAAA